MGRRWERCPGVGGKTAFGVLSKVPLFVLSTYNLLLTHAEIGLKSSPSTCSRENGH